MNRGRSVLVLGIIIVLGAGVVWLLSGGGGTSGSSNDRRGDVFVAKGPKPPTRTSLADLRTGSVSLEGGSAIFEATVDASIPQSLKEGAMTFRWEIKEGDRVTWIVTANVDVERTAAVAATQRDYQSSTIDQSLPGEMAVEDKTVSVTLETGDLEGFPNAFDWTLRTELDGDRTVAPSALATDSIPNEGSLPVGS